MLANPVLSSICISILLEKKNKALLTDACKFQKALYYLYSSRIKCTNFFLSSFSVI